jgi:hypothetical protein
LTDGALEEYWVENRKEDINFSSITIPGEKFKNGSQNHLIVSRVKLQI